jgi:hypothetical protein
MLTQEQVDQFEKQIVAAIEAHLAGGGKLCYGTFSNWRNKGICPISCLVGPDPGGGFQGAVSNKLNFSFTEADMWKFIHGFDGQMRFFDSEGRTPLFLLGQKLRTKYLPPEANAAYPEEPRA